MPNRKHPFADVSALRPVAKKITVNVSNLDKPVLTIASVWPVETENVCFWLEVIEKLQDVNVLKVTVLRNIVSATVQVKNVGHPANALTVSTMRRCWTRRRKKWKRWERLHGEARKDEGWIWKNEEEKRGREEERKKVVTRRAVVASGNIDVESLMLGVVIGLGP